MKSLAGHWLGATLVLLLNVLIISCSDRQTVSDVTELVDTSDVFISQTNDPYMDSTVVAKLPAVTSIATPDPSPSSIPEEVSGPVINNLEGSVLHGGKLKVVTAYPISHMDVHQDVSPSLAAWGPGLAYSRLMRFKSGPGVVLPSLEVECELCESFSVQEGRIYLFHLRQGVRWHDIPPVNGRELTAHDIIFSYTRQRSKDFPNGSLLDGIRSMEAIDPYTLSIELHAPDADFPAALANAHSKIVAPEAVQLTGDLKSGPTIGTGPWILQSSNSSVSQQFIANPNYFEDNLPYADTLMVRIIPDSLTRNAAFRTGHIDIHRVDFNEWQALKERNPDIRFTMHKESGLGLELALKSSEPPFDNILVRKAVFAALNPKDAISKIWNGMAYVSGGFPIANSEWLLDDQDLMRFFDKPDHARKLLADTGIDLPIPVSITVGDFGEQYLAHAQRIADEMTAVGFKADLNVVNRKVFGEQVWFGGQYQIMVGPPAPTVTPNNYLFSVLHSEGLWNTTGHQDDVLDSLLLKQAGELDVNKRSEIILEVHRHLMNQAYRFMPATQISIWASNVQARNFYPNFAGLEYSFWSRVWIDN